MLAIILSGMLGTHKPSAQMFAAWSSAAAELGMTEGARRRMRIEIERKPVLASAAVTAMDEYRRARQG